MPWREIQRLPLKAINERRFNLRPFDPHAALHGFLSVEAVMFTIDQNIAHMQVGTVPFRISPLLHCLMIDIGIRIPVVLFLAKRKPLRL